MFRSIAASLMLGFFTQASAAPMQVTTCMMDTNDKNNPVLYYFPISTTILQCDYTKEGVYITLEELYADGWQLIQLVSPMMIERNQKQSSYSPPILYLHREIARKVTNAKQSHKDTLSLTTSRRIESTETVSAPEPSQSEEETPRVSETEKGGFFRWFKKDKSPGESDSEPVNSVD